MANWISRRLNQNPGMDAHRPDNDRPLGKLASAGLAVVLGFGMLLLMLAVPFYFVYDALTADSETCRG